MATTIVRDKNSGAILNKDKQGLDAYRAARSRAKEHKQLVKDVDTLKDDMNELKLDVKKLIALNHNILGLLEQK